MVDVHVNNVNEQKHVSMLMEDVLDVDIVEVLLKVVEMVHKEVTYCNPGVDKVEVVNVEVENKNRINCNKSSEVVVETVKEGIMEMDDQIHDDHDDEVIENV